MNEKPIIDQAQVDRLVEWGGVSLQKKMFDLFLVHADQRMDQIRVGLSGGDLKSAEAGAHTLKSSAGNVGAHRVQELAQEIEELAEAEKLDDVRVLLPSLETEFASACQALRTMLEGMDE